MKKIVCFTYCLGSGGAERQLISLASFLQEDGYEVTLLTFVKKEFYRSLLDTLSVPYECVDTPRNKLLHLIHLYKRFKELNPDIVIAYLGVPSMIACGMKLLGLNFKLICSERTTTNPIRMIDRARCVLYRFTDFIVPNSITQAQILCSYKPKLKSKILVIHNYTDTFKFTPLNALNTRAQFTILSVGRISEAKNVYRYIQAVSIIHSAHSNIVFEWYGKAVNESYYNECCKLIKDLGLEKVFIFRGPTNNIVDEYKKANVFCLPSIYEGYPNVICEAMSCGLPIICSNVCDNPNIVKEGENAALFNPLFIDDIANAIDKVISLPTERLDDMGKKSRELAVQNFSKTEFINAYTALF